MADDNSPETLRGEIERLRRLALLITDREMQTEIAKMIRGLEHRLNETVTFAGLPSSPRTTG
jgi:hypothetical protein